MKCPYCNYDIKPSDRYCENCGASAETTPVPADNAPYQGGGQYYPQNTNTAYGYGNDQYGYGNDQYGNGYNQSSGSPQYVGFGEAIKLFFVNYVNFKGRSTRSEFWFAYLFQFIVRFCSNFVFSIFGSLMFVTSSSAVAGLGGIGFARMLSLLIDLALFIPALSSGVRRLHDAGRSGLWMLLMLTVFSPLIILIPIAVLISSFAWSIEMFLLLLAISMLTSLSGLIMLIVFWCKPSDGVNKWGAPANPFKR